MSARGRAADDGTLLLTAKITVTQDGEPAGDGGPLPRTGGSLGWVVVIALAALLIGTALVAVVRGRVAGRH